MASRPRPCPAFSRRRSRSVAGQWVFVYLDGLLCGVAQPSFTLVVSPTFASLLSSLYALPAAMRSLLALALVGLLVLAAMPGASPADRGGRKERRKDGKAKKGDRQRRGERQAKREEMGRQELLPSRQGTGLRVTGRAGAEQSVNPVRPP